MNWIAAGAIQRAINVVAVLSGQLTLIRRTREERHALTRVTLAHLVQLARGERVELAPTPVRIRIAGGRS